MKENRSQTLQSSEKKKSLYTKAGKRRKKAGRKKIIRPFEVTTFGRNFKLHAPTEYEMVMSTNPPLIQLANIIEHVSYASSNPYFRTKIFHRLLMKFRKTGCTQTKPVPPPTPSMIKRAWDSRKKNMYGM